MSWEVRTQNDLLDQMIASCNVKMLVIILAKSYLIMTVWMFPSVHLWSLSKYLSNLYSCNHFQVPPVSRVFCLSCLKCCFKVFLLPAILLWSKLNLPSTSASPTATVYSHLRFPQTLRFHTSVASLALLPSWNGFLPLLEEREAF